MRGLLHGLAGTRGLRPWMYGVRGLHQMRAQKKPAPRQKSSNVSGQSQMSQIHETGSHTHAEVSSLLVATSDPQTMRASRMHRASESVVSTTSTQHNTHALSGYSEKPLRRPLGSSLLCLVRICAFMVPALAMVIDVFKVGAYQKCRLTWRCHTKVKTRRPTY